MKLDFILFIIIVFLFGILAGFVIYNLSSITFNWEIRISELGLMLATLSVGVFIPLFGTKWLDNNRHVKMALIDECKESLSSVRKVYDKIEFCYNRKAITQSDKEEINIYFSTADIMLDNLRDSLNHSFSDDTEKLYNDIKKTYIPYWQTITGEKFMDEHYTVIDEQFYKENKELWYIFDHKIKTTIYAIHKL